MLIPELVIYNTLRSLIACIQQDFKDNIATPQKSILYGLFNTDDNGFAMTLNNFNYYTESQTILLKDESSARRLQINVGYNTQRQGLPTIHILLPEESRADNGIGMGEGYQEYEIDLPDGSYKRNFTSVYRSTYTLLITSDNSSEVILIYHAFKNLLFATFEHLELMGIRDPQYSGADLTFSNDLVPVEIFNRNLSISCFYESTVNELLTQKITTYIKFVGTVVDEIDEGLNLTNNT